MVGIDYRLKGIILTCTLKSYMITPIESANVLKVTMKLKREVTSTRAQVKLRRDQHMKAKFLAKFRRDPILVPIPFPESGQSPQPLHLGGPVCTAITTALLTQEEQNAEGMMELCHQWDCLAQQAQKAENEWGRMCGHVHDLMD